MTKRTARASAEQLKTMLEFFENNKELVGGRIADFSEKVGAIRKWDELVHQLNSMGGTEKTAYQWQVVWRDLKSRTSIKVRERGGEDFQIKDGQPKYFFLSELERRVMNIINSQNLDSSKNSSECTPEEKEIKVEFESIDTDGLINYPKVVFPSDDTESSAKKPKLSHIQNARTKPRLNGYAHIARQQADAQRLQAEAAKMQAKAMLIQARAFQRLVGTFEEFTRTVQQLAQKQ